MLTGTGFGLSSTKRRKLAQKNLELYRDITNDVEESDFVPYACFYDHHTIITKNGELCQTIKITGLARERIREGEEPQELRKIIRESLKHHVPNDSFAIWLHTIRRNEDLATKAEFKHNQFSAQLNDTWIKRNNFEHQYVNEVYITIVHEGETAKILNAKNFLRGVIPSRDLRARNQYLERIHKVLDSTVEKILDDLSEYGAARLGIFKENGIYYSEQLRFLEKIINFVDRPMPVVEMDLGTYLTTGEITFAFNAMEVRAPSGKRRFASILTLKEYKESSLGVIDQFLQLPIEFIVTQTVNFVNPTKVLFEYQEIANYNRLSEDPDISRLSELDNILQSNRNNPNDFGEQQLTIFILADTIKQLEENIKKTIKYFAKYGMVVIREDLKFEETYWAQLPGNFVFVSRMQPTYTSHVAGFANLHNMPMGQEHGNHWGDAVTTFHTASGTPYYFNFHIGQVGHTTIVGPADSGKSVITNFLLSEAMKFDPHVYFFDIEGKSELLFQQIGGRNIYIQPYHHSDGFTPPLQLFNPFSLGNKPANLQFLTRWLTVLARTMGYNPTQEDKNIITQAVTNTYAQPENQRNLMTFIHMLGGGAPSFVHSISAWMEGGRYGHLFTASGKGALENQHLVCFHIGEMLEDMALQTAVPSLLLQMITERVAIRKPTILGIHEAWHILIQTHIASDINGWMNYLTQCNTVLLSIVEEMDGAAEIPISRDIANNSVTQIFMPNDDATEDYQIVFGLNKTEFSYLEMMDTDERHFLIRRGNETVVGEMNFRDMDEFLPVLAGRKRSSYDPFAEAEEDYAIDEMEEEYPFPANAEY